MTASDTSWSEWQKFSFRFFFVFLSLTSYLCWDSTLYIMRDSFSQSQFNLSILYRSMRPTLMWLDKHIYHTGFNSESQVGYPGDNHFGVVFYITIFLMGILAAILWSYRDRKKKDYNKLYYWFCLYLRYVLAIVIFGYGITKLIPVQMRHPNVMMMITPYGDLDRFSVLWNFMGMSPGYMMFTGASEVIAAFLMFSRRTAIAGYVLTVGIMANVVALNIFYNIAVKLFSSQLLLYALFLLAPYLKNIIQLFFYNNPVPFSQTRFLFYTGWKKYSLLSVLILVPLAIMVINITGIIKKYEYSKADTRNERIYDVTTFIEKDTVPPLATDTFRWSRFLLFRNWRMDRAVVINMKNEPDWYLYEADTVKKTLTLHNNPDKTTWKILHYTYPSKDRLELTGKWKGRDIHVLLKLFPVDSMYLNMEKIKVMRD